MIYKNISEEQNNSRLDQAATFLFKDYSRSQIQRWILQGNLLVNGEILKAKDKVHTGDEISLDPVFENSLFVTNLKKRSESFTKNYRDVFSKTPTSVNFHLFDLIIL